MIVALTGTPGTGKSSVGKILSRFYDVRGVEELARDMDCVEGEEAEGEEKVLIVDIRCLSEKLSKISGDVLIVEGHLSHLLPSDLTIVLRCNPIELKDRLSKKGWKREKILENTEAELLDIILFEAMERGAKIYEIDTTDREIEEVSRIILDIIEGERKGRRIRDFTPGKIDWISEVGDRIEEVTR
jgi:adenylate kinase